MARTGMSVPVEYVMAAVAGYVAWRAVGACAGRKKMDAGRPRELEMSLLSDDTADVVMAASQAQPEKLGSGIVPVEKTIYKVVLTGGPCAGKSTGLAHIRSTLEKEGFTVLVVPEAATLLIDGGSGAALRSGHEETTFAFQLSLLKIQMELEDSVYSIAKALGKKSVVLCDRGAMDGRAFCTPEMWERILNAGGWSTAELRDGRYDMVLHLVTAANGAEEYYTTANNTARSETPEQAIEQDEALRWAWLGHPKQSIITNEPDEPFEMKLERATHPICQLINIRPPSALYMRQLALAPPPIPCPKTETLVTITILRGSNKDCVYTLYHRQEKDGNGTTCSHQILRRKTGKGSVSIHRTEESLSTTMYNSMLVHRDPEYEVICKSITAFVWKSKKYELEQVTHPCMGESCILIAEDEKAEIPDFFKVPPAKVQALTTLDLCLAKAALPHPQELESVLIPASPELSITSPALSPWPLSRMDSFNISLNQPFHPTRRKFSCVSAQSTGE
eukprot:TRINITY_DN20427_c0_g1_i1.p1 TRINITY_DN20427_c0_g1~~TRINITY_DN20427_c0_g1_i1.p1  ORF type:complete len:505 (+),score=180.46 TRINITY_DN20427_c0_g1_i1:35-1549(+)